jgi:hypothetical protein
LGENSASGEYSYLELRQRKWYVARESRAIKLRMREAEQVTLRQKMRTA